MTHPTTNPASSPAHVAPFADLLLSRAPRSPLRDALSAAHVRSETDCVDALLEQTALTPAQEQTSTRLVTQLANALQDGPRSDLEDILLAFPPETPQGQAVLTLLESLLRIPDSATQDALIRSVAGTEDWARHVAKGRPSLVNTLALNLSLTSSLSQSRGFSLRRLTLQSSTLMIRRALEKTVRTIGKSFILGSTTPHALRASTAAHHAGLTFAYDPQLDTALSANQALKALETYEHTLEQISQHTSINGAFHERPILCVRLPALCARYNRHRRPQIMAEFLPILQRLTIRARQTDIGLLLASEDSRQTELTLDLLEHLCTLPELEGWNGLGLTVQAYDRRATSLIDTLTDLARRTHRRIPVRLVKGACWQSEIHQAQKEGLSEFPVFTRRCHTDVSYIACARKLLAAPDACYAQFATHNPRTIGHILALTNLPAAGHYEFACLSGPGLPLARILQNPKGLNLPCRLHAPIGPTAALMPGLVRQILENGTPALLPRHASDSTATIEALTTDPIAATRAIPAHERPNRTIRPPQDLFSPERHNAPGLNLHDEATLRTLADTLNTHSPFLKATPLTPDWSGKDTSSRILYNPADRHDPLGNVVETDGTTLLSALNTAENALPHWAASSPHTRQTLLTRAADLLDQNRISLMALLVREGGKTLTSAQDEVRDAINSLRHHAYQLSMWQKPNTPLGLIACLSPWSSPLATFVQQISTALAAGNIVLAKPAEQTPFVASLTIRLLHDAGIPKDVLHFLPGDATVGERLVSDSRIDGVLFTGSTINGKAISRQIFDRTGRTGLPVSLTARTGGQNAMLIDSSVHPEQAVQTILTSAFDNSGQTCASLRILLLQEDCADTVLTLLKGAIQSLIIGNPAHLSTSLGPVISADARTEVMNHIDLMRRAGRPIWSVEPGENCRYGHFLPPTLIEIGRVADIPNEVFGPILHIRRFNRTERSGVITAVNAMGYGLTFGVQSRMETRIKRAPQQIRAGNIVINRPLTGATIGAQPFGGYGLSGCGPKADGPFALQRLSASSIPSPHKTLTPGTIPRHARSLVSFLESRDAVSARQIRQDITHALTGSTFPLPTIAGETNTLTLQPIGPVLCVGESWPAILRAVGMALGTGNPALVLGTDHALDWMKHLSPNLSDQIQRVDPGALPECAAMIMEQNSPRGLQAASTLTAREGRIIPIHHLNTLRPEWLLEEQVITTNTTSLCGDPTMMAIS